MSDDEAILDSPTFVDPETTIDGEPYGARTEREIASLVEAHLGLLEPIARRVDREVGHVADVDDLLSAGREALFEAARAFDPERSPFAPYATNRVRWAMLDCLRRDTHGRARVARGRAIAGATLVEGGPLYEEAPAPTEEAHAQLFRRTLEVQAAAMFVGLAAVESRPEDADDPEQALIRERGRHALVAALATLPERDRQILERHYYGGERFDAIADELGVSKSWLSRLHARALETLSERMRERVR